METNIARHSLIKSVALHLLPGILTGIFYFATVNFVREHGYPSVMAVILASFFVLIPFELGFLFYQKKRTGSKLVNVIIPYFQRIPLWNYFVWVPFIILLSGGLMTVMKFTSDYLITLFDWLPQQMIMNMGLSAEFSKDKLLVTYILFLILIVIAGPAVEELYFRGYLLPRMPSRLNRWTQVTHSALFALYHTFTPWMILSRTVGALPLIYVVKSKRNVYLGIISHCLLNSVDFVIGMLFIINAGQK